ncbi:MAG: BrnA antitoxin family protein [Desulfovibrio sp.]|nr:BrnA antitoxin family protein [Desulfovibrio sp.]
MTAVQLAELAALRAMPDSEIDYSDIPPLESMYRPRKEMTTVRIDSDVLVWLRAQGKGYQTKINAILRRAMLAAQQNEQA